MTKYEAALNACDPNAARELIAEGAVYLFSNQTVHHGRAAIPQAIGQNFITIEDEIFQFKNLT